MKKINSLRDHLLQYKNLVTPAQLMTFVEEGSLIFHQTPLGDQRLGFNDQQAAPEDRNFNISYKAEVVINGFTGDFFALSFILIGWLSKNQPGLKKNAVSFHGDILDQTATDISFRIPLSEYVIVSETDGGHNVDGVPTPDAFDFKMAAP